MELTLRDPNLRFIPTQLSKTAYEPNDIKDTPDRSPRESSLSFIVVSPRI